MASASARSNALHGCNNNVDINWDGKDDDDDDYDGKGKDDDGIYDDNTE